MELRKPRTEIKLRGYWADTLALCHPKMLLIIASILTIGHALSPNPIDVPRYLLAVGGVILATLAAYRVNELEDGTTSTAVPRAHHKVLAVIFMASALVCAGILVVLYAWWIAILAAIGVGLIILYNLDVHPLIHNKWVYALTWGALPLCFSEMTQALSPVLTVPTLLLSAWAGVVAIYTLWLWGPRTCGRLAVCRRAGGKPIDRLCHSPVLRCRDRVVVPREVDEHQKVLINLNVISVVLLTVAVIAMRW
jgi:hypothetical protein